MRVAWGVFLVLIVLVGMGPALVSAEKAGNMVLVAIPGAMVVLFLFWTIGARGEHLAWAFFLFALGFVYLDPAIAEPRVAREAASAATFAALALLGIFVTPWFIAAGFAGHVAWDFLPRVLTPEFASLPLACLLFDGVIAIYVARQAYEGRWRAFRRAPVGSEAA